MTHLSVCLSACLVSLTTFCSCFTSARRYQPISLSPDILSNLSSLLSILHPLIHPAIPIQSLTFVSFWSLVSSSSYIYSSNLGNFKTSLPVRSRRSRHMWQPLQLFSRIFTRKYFIMHGSSEIFWEMIWPSVSEIHWRSLVFLSWRDCLSTTFCKSASLRSKFIQGGCKEAEEWGIYEIRDLINATIQSSWWI